MANIVINDRNASAAIELSTVSESMLQKAEDLKQVVIQFKQELHYLATTTQ